MDVGLFTMPLHPPGANLTEILESDMDQIVELDELGYSEAWIGEHFTAVWENIPSPELFIAQAIPLTKQIRLGTGVSCMPNHNPFVLANRIAQLDHMADGRFNWGVGTGSFPGDMEVFGYWDDDAAIDNRTYTREALDAILQLCTDPKPGLYEGEGFRFTVPEPQATSAFVPTSSRTSSRTRRLESREFPHGRQPSRWQPAGAGFRCRST